jgi:hypothetical protein
VRIEEKPKTKRKKKYHQEKFFSFLSGTFSQITAEGTDHQLGKSIRKFTINDFPSVFNQIASFDQTVIDGTNRVELVNDRHDLAAVRSLLLEDCPDILAVSAREATKSLDDGISNLTVTDIFTDFLELAFKTLEIEGIINDLEGKADLATEVLHRVVLSGKSVSEDAGHLAESTASATSLVDVNGLESIAELLNFTSFDGLGHQVIETEDIKTLASVTSTEDIKVQVVHLELFGFRELSDTGQDWRHEVAASTSVDGSGNTVVQVDSLATTTNDRLVLDIIDDQRADVEEFSESNVVRTLEVSFASESVDGGDENE